jgi:hypothetical protein
MLELEKVAQLQQRTVDEVLAEAARRYVNVLRLERLTEKRRSSRPAKGIREEDVPQLVEDRRRETANLDARCAG